MKIEGWVLCRMVCFGCACILGVILVCQMFKHPIINSLVCHEVWGEKIYTSNTLEIERGGDIGGAREGGMRRVGPGRNSFLQFPGTVKL